MGKKGIVKNTFYNIIKSCLQIAFPLITVPYVSRVLMAENVGKVNFGNSIVSYFSLLASLGIYTYAVRECSRVKHDKKLLEKTAGQIFSINIMTALFSYALLFFTLLFAKPLENYKVLIAVQSMSILFAALGADWLNAAMEDFKYIALRTVFFQLFSLAAMFLFVKKPEDYLRYAFINVLAGSGANLFNIFYRRRYCKVSFTRHMDARRHLPPILLLFAMILSQTIYCNSDITLLGFMRGDREVGLYSTAVKIYTIVKSLTYSVTGVVVPKLSYYYRTRDYGVINRLLNDSISLSVLLGFPCVTGIFMIAPEIIEVIAGSEYLEAAVPLRILAVSLAFSIFGSFFGNAVLVPSVREKIFLKICVASAASNVFANLLLIPRFGMSAAAVTTALSELVVFSASYFQLEKEIRIGNLKDIFFAPCMGCAGIVAVSLICSHFILSVWVRTAGAILLGAAAYSALLLLFGNKLAVRAARAVWKKKTSS